LAVGKLKKWSFGHGEGWIEMDLLPNSDQDLSSRVPTGSSTSTGLLIPVGSIMSIGFVWTVMLMIVSLIVS